MRAFEATLIVLNILQLDYIIIDSKKWQHYFFGTDTTQIDLKQASKNLSIETLTIYQKENKYDLNIKQMLDVVIKHGDGDSLLMCRYIKEKLIN